MKTAASLPASVDYLWYGKKVTVDLAACREAMCIKALSLELSELGPTKAFARSVKLHPDTVSDSSAASIQWGRPRQTC
jgi:hypothetical protein